MLYRHGDASSFLIMTGMSRQAFLQLFDVLFIDGHLMDLIAQLGLYLFFVGSTMGIKHLLLDFWCYTLSLQLYNNSNVIVGGAKVEETSMGKS
jgi:hypothetical protein